MTVRAPDADSTATGPRGVWARLRRSGALSLAVLVVLTWAGSSMWRDWQDQDVGAELRAVARPGDIRMISSTTCVFCTRARTWMQAHKVPFEECFVEKEADCMERYQRFGARGTPTLQVRGDLQLGFDARRVRRALAP